MNKYLARRKLLTLSIAVFLLLGIVAMGRALSTLRTQSVKASAPQTANAETNQLLTIIRNDGLRQSEPKRVAEAIKRLGEAKSTEAVGDLVRLLTFTLMVGPAKPIGDAIVEIHLTTPGERYPAAGALVEIGKDSLPALVEVIGTNDSGSLENENAFYAIAMIFKDNPADSVEYLTKRATEASSPEVVFRLSRAADKAAELLKKLNQL